MELPFIYIYHTQRYTQPCTINGKHRNPADEDLGVQVLVTQRPFKLNIPLLNLDTLTPAKSITLDSTPALNLSYITQLAITAECNFSQNATKGLRLHIRSSTDGINYETQDLYTLDINPQPGNLVRKVFLLQTPVTFIKVIAENMNKSQIVNGIEIIVTLAE